MTNGAPSLPSHRSAEARAANADAPTRYLGLVRQLLGLGLSALQETPQKITMARSRLAQVRLTGVDPFDRRAAHVLALFCSQQQLC
jgi:hypothetical protein